MAAPWDAVDILERSAAAGLILGSSGAWEFSSWMRVPSSAFNGFDIVASRPILQGEAVIREAPLLQAPTPDQSQQGWASEVLKAFCKATPEVQARVLATSASGNDGEKAGESAMAKMLSDTASEVAFCAGQPWRQAAVTISDADLQRVCMIWNLNSYAFGERQGAHFEVGCMLNHACDNNVCYASEDESGKGGTPTHGIWVARRDIAAGESLCANYIGELASFMSTPARREMLLSSKLFKCLCSLCRAADDPRRHVPCPGCHIRAGDECALPFDVTRGEGRVHYATPSSAEPGAHWLCPRCPERKWSVESVIPGPVSMGGLTGRAWERVLETNVMHFEQHCAAVLTSGDRRAIQEDATGLLDLVVRSVGRKHWTAVRLAAIADQASWKVAG